MKIFIDFRNATHGIEIKRICIQIPRKLPHSFECGMRRSLFVISEHLFRFHFVFVFIFILLIVVMLHLLEFENDCREFSLELFSV